MDVDFNSVREKMIDAYNCLVEKLNENTFTNLNDERRVSMPAEELEDTLDDIRALVAVIASVYEPDNEDVKNVLSGKVLLRFNPESNEE